MYLINGQFNSQLAVRDRGLAYGDGLFETIAVIASQPLNWTLHFDRLVRGAKQLKIHLPNEKSLLNGFNLLLARSKLTQFVVKIILTRGEGGQGYQSPKDQSANWIMMLNPWPEYPQEYYLRGINVEQLDFKLSIQPALAGIKHLNRLEQVIAKQSLGNEYQEAIICNTDNFMIEGVSSNLYFVNNNTLCLPQLDKSGIEGTLRRQIISMCQQLKIKIQLDDYKIEKMYHCDEVFYSNSIIGLWPVKKIVFLNKQIKSCQPGPIYLELAKKINASLNRPYF